VTAIRAQAHDHRQIVANVALRVDRQIDAMLVHQLGVQMNAGPSAHAIHVHQVIDQQVVPMEIVIHVHHPIVDQVLIVHVAKILMVAIVQRQAMTEIHVRHLATANAVADQIVPEVVLPMIAKSVHAVALAKSA
jgi:hypothetical protein